MDGCWFNINLVFRIRRRLILHSGQVQKGTSWTFSCFFYGLVLPGWSPAHCALCFYNIFHQKSSKYQKHITPITPHGKKKNVFVVFLPGPKSEDERILKIKSNSDIKEKAWKTRPTKTIFYKLATRTPILQFWTLKFLEVLSTKDSYTFCSPLQCIGKSHQKNDPQNLHSEQ